MSCSRDTALSAVRQYFDRGDYLADLRRCIAIASESQEENGVRQCRAYLDEIIAPALAEMGFELSIEPNPDGRHGPFLIASRYEDDRLPTILTYGHGDVVRGLPEQWRDGLDPWAITVEGDHWYGRGTADNKGQHWAVIAALRELLKCHGRLGFNAKILIETGEEVGSPGLDEFCGRFADRLACDAFIACDGPRLVPHIPDVALGNRGGVAFDLVVDLREGSQHSGHWGGVLEDPGLILAHALASIADRKGRILVEDWLPKSVPDKVIAAIRELPFDASKASFAVPADWGEPDLSVPEKVYAWTGFIVLAFLTGRPENPVNGVQPWARASCQIRFTSDIDQSNLIPALRRHLDNEGFPSVEIVQADRNFFPAWRTDPDNPWVDWVRASFERTAGQDVNLVPNSSGGLPSEIFARQLGVPVIWLPHSYTGCKQHGPDEHLLAPMAREALALMTGLFWDLGMSPPDV